MASLAKTKYMNDDQDIHRDCEEIRRDCEEILGCFTTPPTPPTPPAPPPSPARRRIIVDEYEFFMLSRDQRKKQRDTFGSLRNSILRLKEFREKEILGCFTTPPAPPSPARRRIIVDEYESQRKTQRDTFGSLPKEDFPTFSR